MKPLIFDYDKMLAEIRENAAILKEQNHAEQIEKDRYRNITEVYRLVELWKNSYLTKKRHPFKISIVKDYQMQFDKTFCKIRLFVKGSLVEIFNIEHEAADILCRNIEMTSHQNYEYYTIFDNLK